MSTVAQAPHAAGLRLPTRSGLELFVRPVDAGDEAALFDLFSTLTPDQLRFRFLTAMRSVNTAQLDMMVAIDHRTTRHLLAFRDDGRLVGSVMLAADDAGETAEVAVAVAGDHHARGIGWALLRHAAQLARESGIHKISTIESTENHAAIRLEREMGFTARALAEDPSLVLLELALD